MSLMSRVLQRHRVLLALLVLAAFLIWAPIVPYSPSCWERQSVGPVFLAAAFRREFTDRLQQWEVPYVAVDGLVLLRFWDWFADPDDWLINALNKAVLSLVDPAWGADIASIPPRVGDLIAETEREYDQLTCKLGAPSPSRGGKYQPAEGALALQDSRGAKPFALGTEWKQQVTAVIPVKEGRLGKRKVTWGKISE